jgi:DNA-binding response OmpR family regulator
MLEGAHPSRRITAVAGRRGRAERPRVFFAQGDARLRGLRVHALRQDGLEVVEVGDGERLVNALVQSLTADPGRAPDLIIMEAQLPVWSGLDILQRLRRFDLSTPVILLCAEEDLALVEEALHLGVSCVLQHPFDCARLRQVAAWALEP